MYFADEDEMDAYYEDFMRRVCPRSCEIEQDWYYEDELEKLDPEWIAKVPEWMDTGT